MIESTILKSKAGYYISEILCRIPGISLPITIFDKDSVTLIWSFADKYVSVVLNESNNSNLNFILHKNGDVENTILNTDILVIQDLLIDIMGDYYANKPHLLDEIF